jgi:hypothetical protein
MSRPGKGGKGEPLSCSNDEKAFPARRHTELDEILDFPSYLVSDPNKRVDELAEKELMLRQLAKARRLLESQNRRFQFLRYGLRQITAPDVIEIVLSLPDVIWAPVLARAGEMTNMSEEILAVREVIEVLRVDGQKGYIGMIGFVCRRWLWELLHCKGDLETRLFSAFGGDTSAGEEVRNSQTLVFAYSRRRNRRFVCYLEVSMYTPL